MDSTPIGTNTTNRTTSPIDSIPIKKKHQNSHHEHDQQNRQHNQQSRQNNQRIFKIEKEKRMYQRTWSQTHHHQTHNQENLICWLTEITLNTNKRNSIKIIRAGNTRNRTRQNYCQAIIICPTTVTIVARDTKMRAIRKNILSNYAQG